MLISKNIYYLKIKDFFLNKNLFFLIIFIKNKFLKIISKNYVLLSHLKS